MNMNRRRLPLGSPSFRNIRNRDCYYVDKTAHIQRLIDEGEYYFLSRPRRFGKSMLVHTLKELFEGNEELFRGLHIHDHWDWSVQHPVIRLSFDGKYFEPGDLENNANNQLTMIEKFADIEPLSKTQSGPDRLYNLILSLYHKTGQQVVILVDEYDKPILDVIENQELARANRDYLRGLYGIIKGCADEVRFVFVTGVSMFSKVSLFSGLNNLNDISLDPEYATICGYTDADLDTVFAPELLELEQKREAIRGWYDGYHWLGAEDVYNPYDILLLFSKRKFRPYWFETGSPRFLYQVLLERDVSPMELEGPVVDTDLLSKFDVGDIGVEALLFQTGYLTIGGEQLIGNRIYYTLRYPNTEVCESLNGGLLSYVAGKRLDASAVGLKLREALRGGDFEGFGQRLHSFLSGIPWHWYRKVPLARYESWYAGMVYACFRSVGLKVAAEAASSHGQVEMVVHDGGQVLVLEFKMQDGDEEVKTKLAEAMEQMRGKRYADRYRGGVERIHRVAVVFSGDERNLVGVRVEAVEPPEPLLK